MNCRGSYALGTACGKCSRCAPLKVEIQDGLLTISIGVEALCYAVQNSDDWQGGKIKNKTVFAQDVVAELEDEEEDGTTKVHRMLDAAANTAADNGSEGMEEE